MSKKYQNGFFIFGLVVLVIMVTQLDFKEVWSGLQRAGYWFFAVVALWLGLYVINTLSWYVIIRQGGSGKDKTPFSFWWLYKVTVSGFALNYATPGGLMGGEPYRIMALSPIIGTERASSSVILFVMTHIFSHFWFWLLSIAAYVLFYTITPLTAGITAAATAFCLLGLWFFTVGYRKGIAMRAAKWASHIPFAGRYATTFITRHHDQLTVIDGQIAALHSQNRRTLVAAVLSELLCRIASAAEIYFILLVINCNVSYTSCVIILAFTSLFANLLFFLPMQVGGREGGFLMSASALGMSIGSGAFLALIVRLRELVWTGIGLILIKVKK